MATAQNAKVQIETGRTLVSFGAMTDSGDQKVFTRGTIWSGESGFTPDVRPNGIVSGINLLSSGATNDTVRIAAFTAYSKGVLHTVAATKTTITRAGTDNKAKIFSVTMASNGSISVIAGVQATNTTFIETRAATGGPPLVLVQSVELGQIRTTVATASAIDDDEIFQVVGTHTERYDFPNWETNNIGEGAAAAVTGKRNAFVEFESALPKSHTGAVPKGIFLQYYVPVLADIGKAMEFVPVEKSHSVSSTQYYNGSIAASSESLGQGSFMALLNDGVQDTLVSRKNKITTVKFFPDRNKTPYILTQGMLGLARTFPVAEQIQASCTISAEKESAEFAS
jgi:hypothetical protein